MILGVSRAQSLKSVYIWGPAFKIRCWLKIDSYTVPNLRYGAWAELLRFTTTQHDCCSNWNANEGDRIPAIFTHRDGYIHITMAMGNNGNRYKNVWLSDKLWYKLELEQYHKPSLSATDVTSTVSIAEYSATIYVITNSNFQYVFQIKLDGKIIDYVEHKTAKHYNNVKVWIAEGRHHYPPANARVKELSYENTGSGVYL